MYNGIGLTTPRGSGTNGYIQTNKFFIKPRSSSSSSTAPYDAAAPAVGGVRKPNKDILEHDRKRRIELRLLSLREALADQGYTEDEIEEKVSETRNGLEEEAREKEKDGDRAAMPPPSKRFSDTQSHQIAARKQKQLEVFRSALGIKQGFESSDHEHQEESQQEKTHGSENEKCDDEKAQDREKGSVSQHFNKNGKQPLDKVRGGEDFKDLKQHGGENKHGNNSTNDPMEDGEIRSSVRNIKEGSKHQKENNKDDSDSDSDSISGKENSRKRGEKSVKKQKRHDSDSESDRDARVKRKQLGNNLTKSRRYDSDDSKSDSQGERTSRRGVVEKHNKSSKSHKTINSSHPNRRHGFEDSETDDDKKTRSKISEKHRKPSRRHDSEDSLSESEDEKNDKRKVIAGHSKPSSGSNKPIRRHDSENSKHADDEKKSRGKVLEIQREPSIRIKKHDTIRRHDSEDSFSESEDEKNDKRKVIAGHSKPSSRSNKPIRRHDSENSQHADDEKKSRGKVLEIQREPSIRIKEHDTIIDKKIVVNDKKSGRDQRTAYESHDMRSRKFLKKEPELDERKKMYETNDRSSESDTDDEKKRRGKGLEKQTKPTSRAETESRYADAKKDFLNTERQEKSELQRKQRRHDSDYESSPSDYQKTTRGKLLEEQRKPSSRQRIESDTTNKPSDTDDQKRNRGKLLEEQRKPSSRQRIESDTNNKKKEVFNHDKHETRTAVGNAYESHGVRSEELVKESSVIYTEKKRLPCTDDKNSDSDDGRKNTAVAKHNNYKKRVNSVSGSSSSDYSSDTNSVDSSHSDDSSDYSREKYGMKKTGGDSVKRMDISKAKQGFSSMTDKKNKEVQTDHHRDGKIGRDHESWIDSSKIKQALESSSRTERKNGKDVKIDQRSDDYDKRSHLGYQHKTERIDSFEPRRDGDRDGRGSREDRKRKVEDAGISDLSFRESRRPITGVELKARESREPGSYGRSQDYRREEYPNSNRYEDKHESRGPTKDEQRYDDTKRRKRDDSPQYVPRDRHARNHEDDSSRGRRRLD